MAWWRRLVPATAKRPSAVLFRPLSSLSQESTRRPGGFQPNPALSPSLAAALPFLNSRRRKKLKKKLRSPRLTAIQPGPRRRPALESVLSADADFRFLSRARSFLARLPSRSIPLPLAGKLHRELGFSRGRKLAPFALRHPLLFSVGPAAAPHLSLTPFMLSLLAEEEAIANSLEKQRVTIVRKLLMLSAGRRVSLAKLHHCRRLFGLPDDFRDRIHKYPQFFRVVIDPGDARHVLELAHWDPALAVSTLERDFVTDERRIRQMFCFGIPHSSCLDLDEEDGRIMRSVSTFPMVSPYSSEGRKLDAWTVEAEKYRVGVLHEFLSLTLEKRAMIQHIVEFKEEFGLTRHTYQSLAKHPRAFYLAGTEMNWAVFLREAYRDDDTLIEKDPQVLFEEKLRRYARMTEKDLEKETKDGGIRG